MIIRLKGEQRKQFEHPIWMKFVFLFCFLLFNQIEEKKFNSKPPNKQESKIIKRKKNWWLQTNKWTAAVVVVTGAIIIIIMAPTSTTKKWPTKNFVWIWLFKKKLSHHSIPNEYAEIQNKNKQFFSYIPVKCGIFIFKKKFKNLINIIPYHRLFFLLLLAHCI